MQYINDTCMTVVRHSCECLTTHSDDSHQTFVRESHNVCANVAQFNFSQSCRKMVLFMLQFVHIVFVYMYRIYVALRELRKLNCDGCAKGSLYMR